MLQDKQEFSLVYDNIIFSLQRAGGISVYWSELLSRLNREGRLSCYEQDNSNIFRNKISLSTKQENYFLGVRVLRYLPFLKILKKGSVFHSSYYRFSLQKNIVNIVTVHDFTYEYYGKGLSKLVHSLQKNMAIRHSDGIICVSENTKKDLITFFPDVDTSTIKVIYNGVSQDYFPIERPESVLLQYFPEVMHRKFIMYIGDRSAYKNFNIAIATVHKLKGYSLVLVGGGDLSGKELKKLACIKGRFFPYKGVDNRQLNMLYNNAFCLLYPSSYEGFGIPVAEAMRAGCPVVATYTSSIPEVAGDSPLLVKDIKSDDFIKKIRSLEDLALRKSVVLRGLEQVKKFTWEACAEQTYEFYKEIHKRKFS